jgi:hypothetical protein
MAWTEREQLAWAAGFFDGEGSTYADPRPRLSVVQNDPEVLLKFAAAIGNIGALGGGDKVYGRAKKPIWHWRVTGWRDVQAVVAMLWPFLTSQKRKQATLVLVADHKRVNRRNPGSPRRHPTQNPWCGTPHPATRISDCEECLRIQRADTRRRYPH